MKYILYIFLQHISHNESKEQPVNMQVTYMVTFWICSKPPKLAEWADWNIFSVLRMHTQLWGSDRWNYICNSVGVMISVLIWQQSRAVVAEKPNEGEERGEGVSGWRDEKGRKTWEFCGRCLKTLKADDEKSLSPTRFSGFPSLFPFPARRHECPHLPNHPSSIPRVQLEWRLSTAV